MRTMTSASTFPHLGITTTPLGIPAIASLTSPHALTAPTYPSLRGPGVGQTLFLSFARETPASLDRHSPSRQTLPRVFTPPPKGPPGTIQAVCHAPPHRTPFVIVPNFLSPRELVPASFSLSVALHALPGSRSQSRNPCVAEMHNQPTCAT
ncbi:hypothetical protein LX36DRAFT_14134 [Colletotrichum falcatum]|nr:hypothetical protein LX36DRAFT_14134 [Colletotrichum falcatum]